MKSTIILLLTIFMIDSCGFVISKHELYPNDSKAQKILLGLWGGKINETNIFLHIGSEGNGTKVIIVEHTKEGSINFLESYFTTAKGRKNDYISLRVEDNKSEENSGLEGFIFFRYKLISPTRISLYRLNSDMVLRLIHNSKLKGRTNEVENGVIDNFVYIDDSPEHLINLFENEEGNNLFEHFIDLTKIFPKGQIGGVPNI